MRVIADGREIALGAVEVSPTIGMIDFSRRETDDFGVTTVVERGFARRMSVRMAIPFDDVTTAQAELAALRASSARYIADDRFNWMNFEGFYKDFEIDLNVPPISFCTLTIEGLAETEVAVDDGGDPAPSGSASTLRLVVPLVPEATSNVAEDDYPEWSADTTYALGARVIKVGSHRIHESVVDDNVAHDPAAGGGHWIDIGPTNAWAMLDQAIGTSTTAESNITLDLVADGIEAVALIDVIGDAVRIEADGYDRTLPVTAGSAIAFDMPPDTGAVTVTITGAGTVSVGTLLVGKMLMLGVTGASPTAGVIDFSRKETDDFGEVTVVPRAWAKRMSTTALIRTDAIDVVANRIAGARATPCLWSADAANAALTVYGFFKDFTIDVGENVSTLTLSIEGLVEAVQPGTLSVNWTDIVDNDPDNRPLPADGATVGAPSGTPLGDSTVDDVLYNIDANISNLSAQYEELNSTVVAQGVVVSNTMTAVSDINEKLSGHIQFVIDANGRLTGIYVNNDGSTGAINFHADQVSFTKPGSGERTVYENGCWKVYNASNVLVGEFGLLT